MTTRERLHRFVDDLSEQDAERALELVENEFEDPVVAAFREAPVDDEPLSAEEEAALAEVAADRAAGVPLIPMKEFLALTASVHAGSGAGGRSWTRDELYTP